MPLPWKKDGKKTSVPKEAPSLPPLLAPSTSLAEVTAAVDEVVTKSAEDQAKEGRLAAKGVELLGPDAFVYEGRLYKEKSKGRWEATEVSPAELAALRAAKALEEQSPPVRRPSPVRLMPAREKKGLEKLKTLFTKTSKGSGGPRDAGSILKGREIRVLRETAEGLTGGIIETERAAREAALRQDRSGDMPPTSSITTLSPPPTTGSHLNVDRTLVPHFASLRPSRSCVGLIPLPMASAQGGQGGMRCLSDVNVARREVFPPQNLCRLRSGRQPGMYILTARPNIPQELREVYFPEGPCLNISRDIAMTLYRDLYDQLCSLEWEGQRSEREDTVSRVASSLTDEAVVSAIDKEREGKLTTTGGESSRPSGTTVTERVAPRRRSFLDTIMTNASSAMQFGKGKENVSPNRKFGGKYLKVEGGNEQTPRDRYRDNDDDDDDDVDTDAPEMHQEVQTRPANLKVGESSAKLARVKISRPHLISSTTMMADSQNLSLLTSGDSSSEPTSHHHHHHPLQMDNPKGKDMQKSVFELESIPKGTSAAPKDLTAMESVENKNVEARKQLSDASENFSNTPPSIQRPQVRSRESAAMQSFGYGDIPEPMLTPLPSNKASNVRPMVASHHPSKPSVGVQYAEDGDSIHKSPSWFQPEVPPLESRVLVEDPLENSGDDHYPGHSTRIDSALNRQLGSRKAAKPCPERPFGSPRSESLGSQVDEGGFNETFPQLTRLASERQARTGPPVPPFAFSGNMGLPSTPQTLGHPATRMKDPNGGFHELKMRRRNLHTTGRQSPWSEFSEDSSSENRSTHPVPEQRMPEMAPAA
ncbi:hypothetical protein TWF281_004871 [Arthrobotrys megalospora]